jgi:hypothetical protein
VDNATAQTLARLRACPTPGALVGQANQDALSISRRDGETVRDALLRAERTPVWLAVEALLKAKWIPLLEPYLNADQEEELSADLYLAIMGDAA